MEKVLVYLRMKRKVHAHKDQMIVLKDIAYISTTVQWQKKIEQTKLYQVTNQDKQFAVMDSFHIVQALQQLYPNIDCQQLGVTETIVHIEHKKSKTVFLRLLLAWLILFIGTAMTIMNFHYDVSMQAVQQKVHLLFTGDSEEYPLWLQIPYSVGLGLGMILFLNHWFKKRLNEEPSPLEVELFTYQQDLDNYVAYYENELNRDDHAP